MNLLGFDCSEFDSFNNQQGNDSLNALGQIIESIQFTSEEFGYRQPNEVICVACSLPIFEKFLLRVQSFYLHEACAVCSECGMSFDERCFEREGRFYCQKHYYR